MLRTDPLCLCAPLALRLPGFAWQPRLHRLSAEITCRKVMMTGPSRGPALPQPLAQHCQGKLHQKPLLPALPLFPVRPLAFSLPSWVQIAGSAQKGFQKHCSG